VAVVLCTAGLPANCQVVPTDQLKITVKKGEGDSHRPGDKTGTAISVQVLNEVDLPQSEAEVTFRCESKRACVFLDRDKAKVSTMSNSEGVALVEGVRGNGVRGAVTVYVDAMFEDKKGTATINQVNDRAPIWTKKRVGLLAGTLAITGIVLYEILKPGPPTLTGNNSGSTVGPPTGGASIGVPQAFGITHLRIGR
jgi:hypothetical protein